MNFGPCYLILNSSDVVIPSEARDLQFAANCGSLATLGMTILKSRLHLTFTPAYRRL